MVNRPPSCHPSPCRRAKHQADAHHERYLLAVGVAAFRRPLDLRPIAQACLARLMHRQLSVAFQAWRQHLAASNKQAEHAGQLGLRVVLRLQNQLAAAALASWRAHAQRNSRLRTVLCRIQHRELAAALASWRDHATRMRRARTLMQRSLMGTAQWALTAWREAAAAAAEQRWALETVAVADARGCTTPKRMLFALRGQAELALEAHVFGEWRAATAAQRHLRSQVLRAYKHLYFSLARSCFEVLR